jgi:hypothetical protein
MATTKVTNKGTAQAVETKVFVARAFNGDTIETHAIHPSLQNTYNDNYSVAKDVLSKGTVKLATAIGQNDRLIVSKDVKASERNSWTEKVKASMALFFAINAVVNAEQDARVAGLIK